MWSNFCHKNFTNFWPVPTSWLQNIYLRAISSTSNDFVTINENYWFIHVSNFTLAGYFHLNVGLISLKIDLLSVILLHSEFEFKELFRIIQLYQRKNWIFETFWLTLFWNWHYYATHGISAWREIQIVDDFVGINKQKLRQISEFQSLHIEPY